jgi:hypothetical protein
MKHAALLGAIGASHDELAVLSSGRGAGSRPAEHAVGKHTEFEAFAPGFEGTPQWFAYRT